MDYYVLINRFLMINYKSPSNVIIMKKIVINKEMRQIIKIKIALTAKDNKQQHQYIVSIETNSR